MGAYATDEPNTPVSRANAALTWLGGGEPRDVADGHERSTYAMAGVVVAVNAILAWFVASWAVTASTHVTAAVVVPLCLLVGLLVGAVTRAVAAGATRSRRAVAGRAVVAVSVGAVVAELAAILLFSGSIDRRIDEQAIQGATAAPAVAQASADLDRAREARTSLDTIVDQARSRRDEALVVARCEYNPSPACPQTRITGVPGSGPETRTANELLAGAQRELDAALATRDARAADRNAAIADTERQLAQARATAVAGADRGLGARWVAMNDYTLGNPGALLLRIVTIAFFALLSVLPLILRLWRGETSHDRVLAARKTRERAELEADTAIALKRAEVRAEAEILWAEQQLVNARVALAARDEADHDHHRPTVDATPAPALPVKTDLPEEDMYLPIAAEAEAASRAPALLPAEVKPAEERRALIPAIPTIPDVTRTAARWIRPLVPPIVARVIDTTTQPLRAARQAFEEVEEITFSFKRVHKVTVHSEEHAQTATVPAGVPHSVEARLDRPAPSEASPAASPTRTSIGPAHHGSVPGMIERGHRGELGAAGEPRELHEARGPRELPPAE